MNVKFELEELFSRPVDLVMPKAIKNNRIKEYIFSNIKTVYAS
jgi:predicted nucleotidyltransferase